MHTSSLTSEIHWRSLTFAFICATALVILAGCSKSETSQAASMRNTRSNGHIAVDGNNIDIGTIEMSKGMTDVKFTFRNDGEEPVALLEGETSCMCTTAVVKGNTGTSQRIAMRGHGPTARVYQVLDPGEEAELIATFDPNAHGPKGTGPIMRDVTLTTNAMRTPKVTFRFSGTVVP